MLKIVNIALVGAVLVAAFVLYSLEYTVRGLERDIAKTDKAISAERDKIKLLNAEWSSLSRPDRIQHLAENQLKLGVYKPQQYTSLSDALANLPSTPPATLAAEAADPIGAMLEKLQ